MPPREPVWDDDAFDTARAEWSRDDPAQLIEMIDETISPLLDLREQLVRRLQAGEF